MELEKVELDIFPALNVSSELLSWAIFASPKVCFMYTYAPFIVGIPHAFLNGGVVAILISGFSMTKVKFDPGLAYLLNLALADLMHALILCL